MTRHGLVDGNREFEARYRALFEAIDHGFCIIERVPGDPPDFRYLSVNPAMQAMIPLGGGLVGRTIRELFPGEKAAVYETYDTVLRTRRATRFRYEFEARGITLDICAFPIAAYPTQLGAIFQDITERISADDALREREVLARSLLEGIAQALWETNADGEVVADSPSWRAYTGQTVAQWLGYGWLQAIHPDDRENAESHWRQSVAQRQPVNNTFRLLHAQGGWRWTNVRAVPVIDEAGAVRKWVGMNIDVDARIRAEGMVRDSEDRQAFLLRLGDALRRIRDPREVQQEATRLLCAHMDVDRVFFTDVFDGTLSIEAEWPPGPPGLRGTYRIGDLATSAARLFAGEPFVLSNIAGPHRMGEFERELAQAIGMAAIAAMPLMRNDTLRATMSAASATPRLWSAAELRLLAQVGERTLAEVERAQAEDELRGSEQRFRGFAENSADVLWISDGSGTGLEYLSPAFDRIFGASRVEAMRDARLLLSSVHPSDRSGHQIARSRALAGETISVQYRVIRPADGRIVQVRDTAFPVRRGNGRIHQIAGVVQDITEVEEINATVRAERERFRSLVDGIPELIWRALDDGDWTWASAQWTAFTGLSEADSLGLGWLGALHPDDRAEALECWRGARDTGVLEGEWRLRRAADDRYRWFRTRATPVRDGTGAVEWIGACTDVDDLRRLQDEQAVMVAELQHRTRNLITVIRSLAEQTRKASAGMEDFTTKFSARLDALARVQGLLSHADTDEITLLALLRLELDALGLAWEQRVSLDGPRVVLRRYMVQTLALALHELATNARKYGAFTRPEGRLVVLWRLRAPAAGGLRLCVEWVETGITPPPPGAGGGYGRKLIEQALPYALDAETTYDLGDDGLRCTIDLPLEAAP